MSSFGKCDNRLPLKKGIVHLKQNKKPETWYLGKKSDEKDQNFLQTEQVEVAMGTSVGVKPLVPARRPDGLRVLRFEK